MSKSTIPWGFILIGTPLAIVSYEKVIRPLLDRADVAIERVNADEFADKYNRNKAAAATGNPEARQFMEAANRKLSQLQDEAALGDKSARVFIDALRAKGVIAK